MKLADIAIKAIHDVSHPSRGAWIEIGYIPFTKEMADGRTPRGVRGLKLNKFAVMAKDVTSHPSRGAWIEIKITAPKCWRPCSRTPRGVRGLK